MDFFFLNLKEYYFIILVNRENKEKEKEKRKLDYGLKNCTLDASARSKVSKPRRGFSKLHHEES